MSNRVRIADRERLISEYSEKGREWYEQGKCTRTTAAYLRCSHMSEYNYKIARYHRWVYIWEVKQRHRYGRT